MTWARNRKRAYEPFDLKGCSSRLGYLRGIYFALAYIYYRKVLRAERAITLAPPERGVGAGHGAPRFAWRLTEGRQAGVTYGYLWWVADGLPLPAVFAWGFGGQFVYLAPSLDLVAVATTEWQGVTRDSAAAGLDQRVLSVIVGGVLPAGADDPSRRWTPRCGEGVWV